MADVVQLLKRIAKTAQKLIVALGTNKLGEVIVKQSGKGPRMHKTRRMLLLAKPPVSREIAIEERSLHLRTI